MGLTTYLQPQIRICPGNVGKLHQPVESGTHALEGRNEKSEAGPATKSRGSASPVHAAASPSLILTWMCGISQKCCTSQKRSTGQFFKEKNIQIVYLYIYPQMLKITLKYPEKQKQHFHCSHFYVSSCLWSKRSARICFRSVKNPLLKVCTV